MPGRAAGNGPALAKGRNPLERINGRLDNSFGFERHYIRGQAAMTTRVGLLSWPARHAMGPILLHRGGVRVNHRGQ